ncbi:MAG: 1-deoxy-D-xylulose-5-phosphate synthase [Candidatus Omnitrophica bacterium]|nr:1-deoxy-D-xylulose-5-phosphate synthase [Candidatus Omnitrophota bacterium]
MTKLLDAIHSPSDFKKLPEEKLPVLAQEIREFLIQAISKSGGHLASSLGGVELVLALHRVFDAPQDKILWDMGYQAYAHKLLTGRKNFETFRQRGGLSPFYNKDESPYDLFTTGHGGTAISTALGLLAARDLQGTEEAVVAVIGDAALCEGMALEALNHVGHLENKDFLLILNDNRMSIAPGVGGFRKYLNRVITAPVYNRIKGELQDLIQKLPRYGKKIVHTAQKLEESLKGLLVPGMIFEELGFRYFGPIDGHDVKRIISTLENVKRLKGPRFVHVVTKKGKGYLPAEKNPERFHKMDPFDVETGRPLSKKTRNHKDSDDISYTDAFTRSLLSLAKRDKRIVAITAAMPEGTGLSQFAKEFPDRFFDVGMAEQHGIGFAAGLARKGLRPVCAIYSTFLQRAYDQIIHDVCLQELPVLFCIDRAGIVGEDGPTHHGVFDVAYMRCIPNLVAMAPKDVVELDEMLRFAFHHPGPVVIRYPRGKNPVIATPSQPIVLGKAEVVREGADLTFVAYGHMVYPALVASDLLSKEGIEASVVNARFVKPLDEALLCEVAQRTPSIITVEESVLEGGFGSAVLECFEKHHISVPVRRLGLSSRFIEHGDRELLLIEAELTSKHIALFAKTELKTKSYAR